MELKLLFLAAFVAAAKAGVSPVVAAVHAAPLAVDTEYDAHPQYSYAYSVQDALTGDSKTQEETRNGDVVEGSYSLIEPDGTRRIVTYTADGVNGFNAIVHREAPFAKAVVANEVAAPAVVSTPIRYSAVAEPAVVAAPARFAAPVAAVAAPARFAAVAAPTRYVAPVSAVAAPARFAAPVAAPARFISPFAFAAPSHLTDPAVVAAPARYATVAAPAHLAALSPLTTFLR